MNMNSNQLNITMVSNHPSYMVQYLHLEPVHQNPTWLYALRCPICTSNKACHSQRVRVTCWAKATLLKTILNRIPPFSIDEDCFEAVEIFLQNQNFQAMETQNQTQKGWPKVTFQTRSYEFRLSVVKFDFVFSFHRFINLQRHRVAGKGLSSSLHTRNRLKITSKKRSQVSEPMPRNWLFDFLIVHHSV